MIHTHRKKYLTDLTIPMAAVQTGDLLAWAGDNTSTYGDISLKTIRWFTKEKFGHVGIAVRMHDGLDDELLVVDATVPKIRISRLTTEREFYCVPMDVNWSSLNKSFLMSKLGLRYSVMDALRAGAGLHTADDMKWQCAELAHRFYEASGIHLPEEFTPGAVVTHAQQYSGQTLCRVVGSGRTIDYL